MQSNSRKVNKRVAMIEELLNTINNGNYNTLDKNETYMSYINQLTKADLKNYVGGYTLYGTKKEMLKQMSDVCNGIEKIIDTNGGQ